MTGYKFSIQHMTHPEKADRLTIVKTILLKMYNNFYNQHPPEESISNSEEDNKVDTFNHSYQRQIMDFEEQFLDERIPDHLNFDSRIQQGQTNAPTQQAIPTSSNSIINDEFYNMFPDMDYQSEFRAQDWIPKIQDPKKIPDSKTKKDRGNNSIPTWEATKMDQLQQPDSGSQKKTKPIRKTQSHTSIITRSTKSQTNLTYAKKKEETSKYVKLHAALTHLEAMEPTVSSKSTLGYLRRVARDRNLVLQTFNQEIAELNKEESSNICNLYCKKNLPRN